MECRFYESFFTNTSGNDVTSKTNYIFPSVYKSAFGMKQRSNVNSSYS